MTVSGFSVLISNLFCGCVLFLFYDFTDGSTSRTVPIQFDTDKFVGAKQAARYVALEKRKILPEKRFLINE